jgi:hypothetical protein
LCIVIDVLMYIYIDESVYLFYTKWYQQHKIKCTWSQNLGQLNASTLTQIDC